MTGIKTEFRSIGTEVFMIAMPRGDGSAPKEVKIFADTVRFSIADAIEDLKNVPEGVEADIFKGVLFLEEKVKCRICGAGENEDCDAGLHG